MKRLLLVLLALTVVITMRPMSARAQPPVPSIEYYHLDALGSVRAVTDYAGVVVRRHEVLPFGEEWTEDGTPGPDEARLFTGKERDTETGLDYFGARYYRADVGRFTTVDPVHTWQENLQDPQRWNRYAYVRNNPLKYVDPDGRAPWNPADHDEMAKNAAKAAGLSVAQQGGLAAAAKAVDSREFFNDAAHYMPGKEKEAEQRKSDKLNEAVRLEKAGKHEEAIKALGEGLHTVQDKTSHETAGWGKHIGTKVTFGLVKNPDDPTKFPDAHKRAEKGSLEYIRLFQERVRQ